MKLWGVGEHGLKVEDLAHVAGQCQKPHAAARIVVGDAIVEGADLPPVLPLFDGPLDDVEPFLLLPVDGPRGVQYPGDMGNAGALHELDAIANEAGPIPGDEIPGQDLFA